MKFDLAKHIENTGNFILKPCEDENCGYCKPARDAEKNDEELLGKEK